MRYTNELFGSLHSIHLYIELITKHKPSRLLTAVAIFNAWSTCAASATNDDAGSWRLHRCSRRRRLRHSTASRLALLQREIMTCCMQASVHASVLWMMHWDASEPVSFNWYSRSNVIVSASAAQQHWDIPVSNDKVISNGAEVATQWFKSKTSAKQPLKLYLNHQQNHNYIDIIETYKNRVKNFYTHFVFSVSVKEWWWLWNFFMCA